MWFVDGAVRKNKEDNMQQHSRNQKLVFSALCIALYIVTMLCTQSFAFGQYQIRIATALYGLSALFPFLIIPFGLANLLSNVLMGGLGILDIVGGGLVGLCTAGMIVWGKRRGCGNWIVMLAITFIPGLGVPLWLSQILQLPYWLLASSLLVGQCISGLAGMLLVTALERVGAGRFFVIEGEE
jgi:uncharacterized membrane protein